MASVVNEKRLRQLLAQDLSQREIAKRLKIPRTTLQREIKRLDQVSASVGTPAVNTGTHQPVAPTLPLADLGALSAEDVERAREDFWSMLQWWRGHRARQVDSGVHQKTARATYHVENRWIERIKWEAEMEGVTIAAIVNRAFQRYFEGAL
jgi:IS30 family transposase